MTENRPWTPTDELTQNPQRRERWCFERLVKEWPSAGVPKEVKAMMFMAAAFVDEDGPMAKVSYDLDRIATALEKLAGINQ